MAIDMSLFGEAKEQTNLKWRNFKIVENGKGSNKFRIGPAFRSLAASGRWFVYFKQHYGYRTAGDEKNPNGYIKTFVCPQEIDRNTEMVKVSCPECDKIAENKLHLEAQIGDLKRQGLTQDQIDARTEAQKLWLKEHNLEKKYLVLVKNENNEWGVLYLPFRAKQALDSLVKKMRSEGINPLAMKDGVWLEFSREGKGFDTVYGVDAVYEYVDAGGRKAKTYKMDTMTQADFEAMASECPDLTEVGRRLSQQDIQALVDSNGDPEEVDRVFSKGQRREASPSPVAVQPAKVVVAPTPPAPQVVQQTAPAPAEDDELAELERKLAEAKAKKAAASVVRSVPEPTAPIAPQNLKDLNNEEFLSLFKKQ